MRGNARVHRSKLWITCLLAAACGAGSPSRPPPAAAPAASAAPPAAAPPAAAAASSAAEAEAAYEAKQWARCAGLYTAEAAQPSTTGGKKQNALYNAACCHARDGKADAAFAALDRALEAGLRDAAHVASDPDLASLHGDPRWPRLVTAVKERAARWEAELEASIAEPALRRELLALRKEDQDARNAAIQSPKDPALLAAMQAVDRKTTARMKEIVAKHGWPGKRLIGEDGAGAAWLLVQHADADVAFQKQCLELMKPLVDSNEVSAANYAYLYDRVAVAEKRPQRWGTQFGPDGEPQPIEDPDRVDERRKAIGLPSMAEYKQMMRRMYGPPK